MAPFHLVDRVAPFAIVAFANVFDNLHAFVNHAVLHHGRGDGMLEPIPVFAPVEYCIDGHVRRRLVGADVEAGLVFDGVHALRVLSRCEAGALVVAEDRTEGGEPVLEREEAAKTGKVGEVLAQKLVDVAGTTDLKHRNGRIEFTEGSWVQGSGRNRTDVLDVQFPAKEVRVGPCAAHGEEAFALAGEGWIACRCGHDRACPERCQIQALDHAGGS